LTDANRERDLKELAQHHEPNPDRIGSSSHKRIALLDLKKGVGPDKFARGSPTSPGQI
jgi:hypothetical protein